MSLSLRRVPDLLAAAHRALAANTAVAVRWRHSRPEDVGESRRNKMLNRPLDANKTLTGRAGKPLFFLNTPTSPAMGQGRSDAAGKIRGKFKHCSSWQEVMDLLETAKMEGKLEASVLGAAMQTCGNKGWWEGLVEIRQVQQEERVVLFPIQQGIAMNALSHCLKEDKRHRVVADRVPLALEMGKAHWREVEPAGDSVAFNCSLSSALKLATRLECEAAYTWGSQLWVESQRIAFSKHRITLSTYICFLEQYKRYDEVDAVLTTPEVTDALDVVLLGSLLDCSASRGDWQRAEALYKTFMKVNIKPDMMAQNQMAKVYIVAGRPSHALDVYDLAIPDLAKAMREDFRVAQQYPQALLVVCHSSLDPVAIERLRKLLFLSLEKGSSSPRSVRDELLKMRSLADKLAHRPREVFLRDVLIIFNAREQSVMAEWQNYAAGSNYLEGSQERQKRGI